MTDPELQCRRFFASNFLPVFGYNYEKFRLYCRQTGAYQSCYYPRIWFEFDFVQKYHPEWVKDYPHLEVYGTRYPLIDRHTVLHRFNVPV